MRSALFTEVSPSERGTETVVSPHPARATASTSANDPIPESRNSNAVACDEACRAHVKQRTKRVVAVLWMFRGVGALGVSCFAKSAKSENTPSANTTRRASDAPGWSVSVASVSKRLCTVSARVCASKATPNLVSSRFESRNGSETETPTTFCFRGGDALFPGPKTKGGLPNATSRDALSGKLVPPFFVTASPSSVRRRVNWFISASVASRYASRFGPNMVHHGVPSSATASSFGICVNGAQECFVASGFPESQHFFNAVFGNPHHASRPFSSRVARSTMRFRRKSISARH
mmetsp:Transcript_5503/g.20789  ORF Transcript_5503/g.20789 Transcript_5503/m.20789 type:complete len:291 (+) Transcript_5503:410-1282(+)